MNLKAKAMPSREYLKVVYYSILFLLLLLT